jgi:antibiotic biosynthesis monooxygenase (ABM) superfamily enzyme
MGNAIEIVKIRVAPEKAAEFVRARAAADTALQAFDGFIGTQLCAGKDNVWTLLVSWTDAAAVTKAQAVTLSAPGLVEIKNWLSFAEEFLSFETVTVEYQS